MRATILIALLASLVSAQSLTEHAAAAAGGSAGGVAGKKVSDGLTAVFEKVDKHTQKAAKGAAKNPQTSNEPLFDVGPGVVKKRVEVPPPPPPAHSVAAVHKPVSLPVSARVPVVAPAPQVEQPPQVTADNLRSVTAGMQRSDVLKLGVPSAKITMYDDGHLVEIYRYLAKDANVGTVRVTDGTVSSVQIR